MRSIKMRVTKIVSLAAIAIGATMFTGGCAITLLELELNQSCDFGCEFTNFGDSNGR